MKRYLILFLCFITVFWGCNLIKSPDNANKNKEQGKNAFTSTLNTLDNSGAIIYGRYGESKEICSINPRGENYTELYSGNYDIVSGFEDKIVVYSNQDDNGDVYLYNKQSKNLDLLAEGFRFVHKPAFNSDGTRMAFYAYNTTGSERFKARIYCMDFKDAQTHKIDKITEEVKHISFVDSDRIIYAKKCIENGKELYQIFSYSLKDDIETRIMESTSNDVNPIVSPDGKKVAFLCDKYRNYNLFVLNLENPEDKSIIELDTSDAVVGESLVWSSNSTNIAYVVLNGVTKYSVKVANINEKSASYVGDGYVAAFSPSGESIIYASYLIDDENKDKKEDEAENKIQVIYRLDIRDIGNKDPQPIWEFAEKSLYSRSINMLYWTNKLGI
jgi:Tol biopolymer transport system component